MVMVDQYPIIVLLVPLFGALVVGLAGMTDRRICFPMTIAALTVSLVTSLGILQRVIDGGVIRYFVGGWSQPVCST